MAFYFHILTTMQGQNHIKLVYVTLCRWPSGIQTDWNDEVDIRFRNFTNATKNGSKKWSSTPKTRVHTETRTSAEFCTNRRLGRNRTTINRNWIYQHSTLLFPLARVCVLQCAALGIRLMVDISAVVQLLKFIIEHLYRLYGYDEAEYHADDLRRITWRLMVSQLTGNLIPN